MLVLTLKKGKKIDVSGAAQVIVLGFKGNAVKLGFVADDGVRILRTELVETCERDSGEDSREGEQAAA